MNALEIKSYLYNNQDKLIQLLEHLDFTEIRYRVQDEIRCAYEEGWNLTGVKFKLSEHNISYSDYSNGIKGDIFLAVRNKLGYSEDDFFKSFKYICDFLKINGSFKKIEKPKIFGGIFDKYKHKNSNLICNIKAYPMEWLDDYDIIGNELFQKDGIDLLTQRKFKIGYDWNTNRIIIPEFSFEGELVGVTGRYNGQDYDEYGESKYYPIIEFPKSQVLFGYCQNYYDLCNSNIFLVESQKSVMKMYSIGKRNFLALGGKSLSDIQIKYIQNLNPKSIIVSLDEDAKENEAIELCNMLKPKTSFMTYKVGYIYDRDKKYLEVGSKNSICDLEENKIKRCVKKYINWI
ncbi:MULTISPECIES: hypothetical protein [unclassified Clostridium]|uniref:hypothetical protein n=1 Tax=unclassified Clostridium TaxID=2614128 RepID=UPI00207932E8|nr:MULTISPECIES: hypothetical protein [unclassified Clostridium]